MPQYDVFFYEAFAEERQKLEYYLEGRGIRAGFTDATIQEYGSEIPPAPIISLRTQSIIPPTWAETLRGLLTRSTGYDHIATYRNTTGVAVPAGYLPLYCNRAVAEQALLLWMALLRRLPVQVEQFRHFHRDGLTGRETAGKTLVVVGVGNIGSQIVRIGQGLDMKVIGVDPLQKVQDLDYQTIEQALPQADILVCSMNLTAENRGYFNRNLLAQAHPGLIFVNIARGELMCFEDFPGLLDDGTLGALGIDVYDHEPELAVSLRTSRESSDPVVQAILNLSKRPNVICTPHNSFNTSEAVEKKSEQSVEQLLHLQSTGSFLWPVPYTKFHP